MEVEYKKKHRQLKVKLLDKTVKTFMVDDSASVQQLTEIIGTRLGTIIFLSFIFSPLLAGKPWVLLWLSDFLF